MEVAWLEDFLAVVAHGGFSRAAENRNITQPALSRRIRALEDWVGTPLFHRTTHTVELTAAGESFQVTAEEILRRLASGRDEAREVAQGHTELLRFAATNALSLTFFPAWLRRVETTLPFNINVQMVANHMEICERMMIQGQSQFLLCHHYPAASTLLAPAQFRSVHIGDDVMVPVSAPDADGRPLHSLPGRADAPVAYVAYRPESGMGRIVAAALETALPATHLKPTFTSHLAKLLVTMALDGRGLGWSPLSLVAEHLERGELVRAGDASWDIPMEIHLYRSRARQSPVAEKFWAHVAGGAPTA
ncbi:LysR family transcriptional regulator [Nitrospirillum sp. BR 11164]|uniref:LysR family transcriptional regulator n=1 Tax=Nitrospirillum sp. BR 11164 TaxID=3104324 RepID=UPI002AFF5D56|nr:LysR family transcriptional regulator [Nitrospirillum sp. BR 11164]MEA1651693.1 LysR family transcriptional regulator [Nitrospirillum sp. BR 11164]